MKTQVLIIFLIAISFNITYAKVVYVNGKTGNDANDGSSWQKAYKTIQYANGGSHSSNGDELWIAGNCEYLISSAVASTTNGSTSLFQNSKNWYGGFVGSETNLSQRILEDYDKNGIVEPWEFKNPTELTFNLDDATGLGLGAGNFNGFTITGQAIYNSRFNYFLAAMSNETKFTNNVVKNINVICNMAPGDTWGAYTPFFRSKGLVRNCLFENNTVKVNALNYYCYPFINIEASGSVGLGTKFENNVIRNNKVTVDYTKSDATNNGLIKGLIINVLPAKKEESLPTLVASCVVNNNEAEYLASSDNISGSVLSAGAIITLNTQNNKDCVDSIVQCTVVNNKGVRIKSSGIYISYDAGSYHFVENNVFYNNQNSRDAVKFIVDNMQGSIMQNVGIISNNITNGGALRNENSRVINQDNSLNTACILFKLPTIKIGVTDAVANWSLISGSYLCGKGTDIKSPQRDLVGGLFKTPRAVGAFEIK